MALIRRALRVLGPLVMLALFVEAFLRPPVESNATTAGPDCQTGGAGAPDIARDIARLERCVALDRTDVELLATLACAYESEGRVDRAEAAYRRALTIDPHDGDVHLRLGALLLRRGDVDAARAEGAEALRWQPGRLAARELAVQTFGSRGGGSR